MARPGVSYLEVAQAANQLVEQNKRPSIEAVRHKLGTGSNSTINQHLRQWRERQGHQVEAQQGLPNTLLIAVKGLYETLRETAEQKIKGMEQESQQTIAQLQQQLAQREQAVATLTQQQDKLKQERHPLQQQCTEQALELRKQQVAYQGLQEKYHQLKKDHQVSRDELNHSKAHARQFEMKFEKGQGRLEAVLCTLKKAEDNVLLLQDKNHYLTQEKATLLAQLKHFQAF